MPKTMKKSSPKCIAPAPEKDPSPAAPKSKALTLELKPGETREQLLACAALSSKVGAATIAVNFGKGTYGELSLMDMADALKERIAAVHSGKLQCVETMLISQATALDAIFVEMARRSALNMGEYLPASETYMRLAMKAQAQCRATLETLAEIKNPPVIFVKQANIAHGHQQVNNGALTGQTESEGDSCAIRAPVRAPAGNPKFPSNELLSESTDATLDLRGTRAPGDARAQMETVGTINGTAH